MAKLLIFTEHCCCYFSNEAMTSISTSAPLGSVFTATAERAGNGSLK